MGPSDVTRWAHLVLMTLCYAVSAAALLGNLFFLSFAWEDVIEPMRVLWIGYELLVLASLLYAQHDYDPAIHRLRGPLINSSVVIGVPLLVLIGAFANV